MIKKVIKIRNLNDKSLIKEDLQYWLSKSPQERIEAVEILRRQFHGNPTRLQRIVRIIEQRKS